MKKLGLFVIFMGCLMAVSAQTKTMSLKGEASTMKDGEKLYLTVGNDTVSTATVLGGKFAFDMTGVKPSECLIMRTNAEGKPECVLFYLDYCDSYVKLSGEVREAFQTRFINCEVTGNPTDAIVREINDMVIFDNVDVRQNEEFKSKMKAAFARGDMASAYVGYKYMQFAMMLELMPDVKASMDKMSPEVLATKAGQEMKKQYAALANLGIGAVAPDFTLNTPEGKPVTMSEYVKGKKLVLIDFWASWCGPCRKEGENVKAIYADYHDKGFDVLGVSLDNNLEAWKKAIKDDGIVWGQVSDLKRWESPMPELYNFSGIPHLVLVDGEGRIVAKNLRGEALRAKVAEICK